MTDETPEQIAVQVLGEHRMGSDGRCGHVDRKHDWPGVQDKAGDVLLFLANHRAHVAAELATALRAAGWLVEGETEWQWAAEGEDHEDGQLVEWTTEAMDFREDAELQIERHGGRLMRRLVGEWQRVEDGA